VIQWHRYFFFLEIITRFHVTILFDAAAKTWRLGHVVFLWRFVTYLFLGAVKDVNMPPDGMG
jgi:hypothetical protein